MKTRWKVCATKARPNTAMNSQIASPIHMAARKGRTSRKPREMTRATSAAMLGPGDPAATSSAPAKISSDVKSMRLASDHKKGRPEDRQIGGGSKPPKD